MADVIACIYCRTRADLRPYGPRGAFLCFSCMKAEPEREAEAFRQFAAQLEAAGRRAVIGHEAGPYPLESRHA